MEKQDRDDTHAHVDAARLADHEAFAALVQRFRGRLTFWISVRMGPLIRAREAVEDVLQETLIEAHKSLDKFEDRGSGSFYSWLLRVAENRIRDLHKYHTAQKRSPGREAAIDRRESMDPIARLATSATSPSGKAGKRELVRHISQCMDGLPDELRSVIVLHVIEDRSFREVGERIGKSASRAQVLYCQALKRLRDEFNRRTT